MRQEFFSSLSETVRPLKKIPERKEAPARFQIPENELDFEEPVAEESKSRQFQLAKNKVCLFWDISKTTYFRGGQIDRLLNNPALKNFLVRGRSGKTATVVKFEVYSQKSPEEIKNDLREQLNTLVTAALQSGEGQINYSSTSLSEADKRIRKKKTEGGHKANRNRRRVIDEALEPFVDDQEN